MKIKKLPFYTQITNGYHEWRIFDKDRYFEVWHKNELGFTTKYHRQKTFATYNDCIRYIKNHDKFKYLSNHNSVNLVDRLLNIT